MRHRHFLRTAEENVPRVLVRITDPRERDLEYLKDAGFVELDGDAYRVLVGQTQKGAR